ncbi:MAG: ABC transporter substrate-binding protein [Burkholderiales bacterium]
MKRREFITLLGSAAATWPLSARAQQPARVWRIGWLITTSMRGPSRPYFQAFKDELRVLGYMEDQNFVFITREAEGNLERLPALAQEVVAARPDLIVAATTPAIAAAQRATSTVPIVMSPATDPLASGFVKSLARPDTNMTGVSNMTADLTAKSLELLRTIVPAAARIAVLMSANPVHPGQYREAEAGARVLGVMLIPVTARTSDDLEKAFAAIAQEKCDALAVLSDPMRPAIIELARRANLPTIYQLTEFVKAGGLISYGPSFPQLFRRVAVYVDKILKGAPPAELPVEQPTKFELAINLKTAKALGLEVPPSLLARADEVIE